MAKLTDREVTAHHEAAHAVVGHVLGMLFARVTIERDRDSAGHVLFDDRPFDELLDPDDETAYLYRRIAALCAGYEGSIGAGAEIPHAKRESAHDFTEAGRRAAYIANDDEAVIAEIMATQRAEAAKLVAEHWSAIERVAAELLTGRDLTQSDVARLIGEEA